MATFAVIAPYLPAPDNTGGRIRVHRLARALSLHGPVDLFARSYPIETSPEAGDPTAALSIYRRVVTRPGDLGCVLPYFSSRRVRQGGPWRLRADLESAHRDQPYTAVLVCHAYAWATAARLASTLRVLDEHNIESDYVRAVDPGNPREAALMARWERGAWHAADLVTACTPADAAVIRSVRTGVVSVVPNGADVGEIPYVPPSMRRGHDVLFVGAMSHGPNVAAAEALVHGVLPRVLQHFPDATVTLCGRAPSPAVRALAGPRVTVTGTVPAVQPYLARAGAYVNFVRAGAGSSLKVPEALAAGLPLVSTALGVRGFPLAHGRDVLLAETVEDCADAVVRAWRDPTAADTRAAAGRVVALHHDWTTVGVTFTRQVMAMVPA